MGKLWKLDGKLLMIILVLSAFLTGVQLYTDHAVRHGEVEDTLKLYVANVESDLDFAVSQTYTIQALIMGSHGNQVELAKIGTLLARDDATRFIKYVFIAPEGIVDQVYPREGYEHILGTNLYSADYENAAAVQQSLQTESLVISPAYTTRTGDRVIIGRIPVNLPQSDGTSLPWGIVSVCVSFPEIFDNLRTDVLSGRAYGYRVLASDGEVLVDKDFQNQGHILAQDFTLAGMSLRIEAAPVGGWWNLWETLHTIFQSCLIGCVLGLILTAIFQSIRTVLTSAKTDELTGLLNRAAAEKEVNRILKVRNFDKGAFLMMDMDNFKAVNDSFGHRKGDEALVQCAKLLKSLFRPKDVVCRLGGDEFVVFLPYAGDSAFLEEKIQKLLQSMNRDIVQKDGKVHISASIGLALAPNHGTSFAQLYANADAALYRAKAMGRNCCMVYDGIRVTGEEPAWQQSQSAPDYASRRSILIVDDDFINREVVKNIFSDRFSFLEAENGQQGLDIVSTSVSQLCAILVDARMPVMDGLEMLRILHDQGITEQLPVFMITAYQEDDVAETAYACGVHDVIFKPIVPILIQNRVQKVIELYQARAMLQQIIKEQNH